MQKWINAEFPNLEKVHYKKLARILSNYECRERKLAHCLDANNCIKPAEFAPRMPADSLVSIYICPRISIHRYNVLRINVCTP